MLKDDIMKKMWILRCFALLVCLAAIACDKSSDDEILIEDDLTTMSLWMDNMISQCGMCEVGNISEYLCGKEWTLDTYALYEANTDWKNLVRYEVYQGEVLSQGAGISTFQFNADGTRPLWVGTSPYPGAPKNPDPVEATWRYDAENGYIVLNTVYETEEKSEIKFYLRGLSSTMLIFERINEVPDPFDRRMLYL